MRKSKKKKGDMVFKLDLDKAYDRVNWKFLQETLVKFKFPPVIISLIMFGLTHSSNTILWNGSKTEAFTLVRGIRQGDPLSPYLFVLCMECLGVMIESRMNNSRWKPLQMVKNGTNLSHLFFADDVLLFAKATTNQAQVIKGVLENFCVTSGMKISHAKSRFYTSAGVSRQAKENIAICCQIQATDRFDKYLGFKMLYGTGDKGMHIVGWDKITQPRKFGGQLPFNIKVSGGSAISNALAKALNMLRDGFTLKIGDGNSSFWYDPWVIKDKLSSVVPFVDIHDTSLRIRDVWDNGMCQLNELYTAIPDFVRNAITPLQSCIVSDLPDIWTWNNSSSGIYSSKDAYDWLLNLAPCNNISDHCLFLCGDSVDIWNMYGLHSVTSSIQGVDRITWCKQTAKIHSLVHASSVAFIPSTGGLPLTVNRRRVTWTRSAEGFVCLNVDAAGYGGLLRNRVGDFIWRFYGVAATPNILFAEIMAIWYGLKLCWERGFHKVLCCSDSLLSINLIKGGVTAHHRFANEILCIQKLLANDWEVTLSHTLCEGNACADVLAKLGASSDSSLVNVSSPPSELVRPLWDDAWGVEFIRE
ncbi:hypothetical protein TSUD_29940 [Trifolium subterraneum]|uniref:Reverse transcriptase domain-containing protein n=1 Tax=Trifolium subterraneum TaxID=3900 RepID=A0A2Z6MR28_TRISU|nr:hypothetical protein TSUD_29940 [Trifolium subterraneum]